jgi:RNA polymerase sigma factor (sigma-70 family)
LIVALTEELWCEILSSRALIEGLLALTDGMMTLGFTEESIGATRSVLFAARKGVVANRAGTKRSKDKKAVARWAREMCSLDRDGELASLARQMAARASAERKTGKKRAEVGFKRVESASRKLEAMRHRFLQSNQGLVAEIAKRYRNRGLPLSDLIQEGNLGLISALNRFDHKKGFKFSTYACWWIQSAVGRAVESKVATVRVPVSAKKQANLLQKTRHALLAKTGRIATEEDIAAETGWDRGRLERARTNSKTSVVSLDQTISSFEGLRYSDVLADEETISPFDNVVLRSWSRDLEELLKTLSPEERTILNWRFGLTDFCELTLEEIGRRFGLSRERIRQIQEGALSKLRERLQLDAA